MLAVIKHLVSAQMIRSLGIGIKVVGLVSYTFSAQIVGDVKESTDLKKSRGGEWGGWGGGYRHGSTAIGTSYCGVTVKSDKAE